MPKQKKTHCLTWLYKNLCEKGINKLCIRHEISSGIEDLHIVYLDKLLNERFITIFRTSRLCYRIRYNGQYLTARTAKSATALVLEILSQILLESEYAKTMTLIEYVTKVKITHKDELELYIRNKDKKF